MNQSPLFSGLLYAMIFMMLGTFVTSLLMLTTSLHESSLFSYTMSIHGVAMFVGGLVSGKRSGRKGWYHGGMLGLVYTLIVWIVGFLSYDAGLSAQTLYLLIISFIAGCLGGMIGINLKK